MDISVKWDRIDFSNKCMIYKEAITMNVESLKVVFIDHLYTLDAYLLLLLSS